MNSNRKWFDVPGYRSLWKAVLLLPLIALITGGLSASNAEEQEARDQTDSADMQVLDLEPVDEKGSAPAAESPKRRNTPIYSSVDEIIVTSQRRAVQSNEMPISVSTLDSETLDFHNMTDTNVTQLYTPNVAIFNEPTWSFISVRGMGADMNPGFEQSVGIVFDYINMGKADFLINSLLDAQQLEVLRGPQGIIVAKNATAGAYVITSARPEHEWGGKYDVSTFQADKKNDRVPFDFSGAFTGPIIEDVLAFRIAAYAADTEGQTYNSKLDRYQADDTEKAVRASLLWDVTDDLDFVFGVSHALVKEAGPNHELAYVSDEYRAIAEQYGEVEDDQFNDRSAQDYPGFVDRYTTITSVNGNWELSPNSKIGLAAGYAITGGEGALDADWGPAPVAATTSVEEYDQYSVEVNYAYERSTAEEKELQREGGSMKEAGGFLLGALYFTNNTEVDNDLILFPNGVDETLSITGVCAAAVVCDAAELPVVGNGSHTHNRIFHQTTDSYAVFAAGDVAVPWTDRWMIGAGVRYVYETKTVDYVSALDPQEGVNLWPYFIPDTEAFTAQKSRSEDALTWRVTLQWFPTSHEANYFMNIAKGWKAGGYNATAGIPDELEFGPETSWSTEAGAKLAFFDDKIKTNITLFYSEFDDLQTSTYNGEKFIVGNAGSAYSQGAELEFWLVPWEDIGFVYALQASLLEVRFEDYKNGPCPAGQTGSCDRSGALKGGHLPWQAGMSLTYDEPVEDWGIGFVGQVGWTLRPNDTGRDDGDPKHEVASLSWVNFRLGIRDIEDRWHLSFVCIICIGDGSSGGFDVPVFAGTHAHIPRKGPLYQLRLYGYF